jgi:hypothetical protein
METELYLRSSSPLLILLVYQTFLLLTSTRTSQMDRPKDSMRSKTIGKRR